MPARHRVPQRVAIRPSITLGRMAKWVGATVVLLAGGTVAALGALVASLGLLWLTAGLISHLL